MNIRAEYLRGYDLVKDQYLVHKKQLRRSVSYPIGLIALGIPLSSLMGHAFEDSFNQVAITSIGGMPTKIPSSATPEKMSASGPIVSEAPHISAADVENELLLIGGATVILAEAAVSARDRLRLRKSGLAAIPEQADSFVLSEDERQVLEGIERVHYGFED